MSFFLVLREGEDEVALLVLEVVEWLLLGIGVKLVLGLLIIVVLERERLSISIDSLEEVLVFEGDWEIGAGSSASGESGICGGDWCDLIMFREGLFCVVVVFFGIAPELILISLLLFRNYF